MTIYQPNYPDGPPPGFFTPDARWCWESFGWPWCGHKILGHPEIVDPLESIEWDLRYEGLLPEIKCVLSWAPRHQLSDPSRPLSLHAWGLALDINPDENPYGVESTLNPKLVEIFETYGFEWGGRWKTPDPMHFQWEAWREIVK